jgi:hypothetical protein
MGSISQDSSQQVREEPTVYDSRAFSRLQRFKQGLVLDLFLQRDLFWELVRQLRKERGIAASVQLPPEAAESWMALMPLLPSDAPEYPGYKAAAADKVDFYRFADRWSEDIGSILSAVLPDELRHFLDYRVVEVHHFYNREHLSKFCAACVLYDPPETKLREFARYHDPPAYPANSLPEASSLTTKHVKMRMSAIEERSIGNEELRQQQRFYESLLLKIDERLTPQGIDLRSIIEDIHREHPELKRELSKELDKRFYINVDEHTTERDAVRAYRTIASSWPRLPAGTKPQRNQLIAVQCAIFHDRHNKTDASDKRRHLWTYKRLAEEFSLASAQAAKDHVKLGRKLLKN